MLDKNIMIGILIMMFAILIGYIAFVTYIVYWDLIWCKVEGDFATMIECRYEDGSTGYVPGYCFKATKFNNFVYDQYCKKFKKA